MNVVIVNRPLKAEKPNIVLLNVKGQFLMNNIE